MKKLWLVLILCVIIALACGDSNKQPEGEKPYGHPDELKDTTRLDPAKTPSRDSSSAKTGDTNRGPRYR